MGKIYTSYFGQLTKLRAAGIEPISISLYPPNWYAGKQLTEIAPHAADLLAFKNGLIPKERFEIFYRYKLTQIGKENILKKIEALAEGKDCALLCFEKPTEFCHRHILAEFISSPGNVVKEWGV